MAFVQFGQQLRDPVSYPSFGGFMVGNHATRYFLEPVSRLRGNVKPSYLPIPTSGIHYAGLGAGVLLSGVIHDIAYDPNIQYIVKRAFDNKENWTPIDHARYERAWDQAYQEWVSSEKASSYIPAILSVSLSVYTATGVANMVSKLAQKTKNTSSVQKTLSSLTKVGLRSPKLVSSFGRGVSSLFGPWGLAIGSIIHFLSWDQYFFQPIINKEWGLMTSSQHIRQHEEAILQTLADAYPTNTFQESANDSYTLLFRFLNDDIHTDPYIQEQINYCPSFGDCSNEEKEWIISAENRNFFNRDNDPSTYLRSSVFQVPVLFHDSYSSLWSVPDLTEVIDGDLTRGEVLQEHLTDWNIATQKYRSTLSQQLQVTLNNWQSFFRPFRELEEITYNFYRHIVETKGRLSFSGSFNLHWDWQSKGMLDALYFGSRGLDESINIASDRLYLESQALQLGLMPEILHALPDNQIRHLITILGNEYETGLLDKPSELYELMVEYINLMGSFHIILDPWKISEFEKFDYQTRLGAIYLGISPAIVNQFDREQTPYIHQLVRSLEEQDQRQQAFSVYATNLRWDWTQIGGQYDVIEGLIAEGHLERNEEEDFRRKYRELREKIETMRVKILTNLNESLSEKNKHDAKYFDKSPYIADTPARPSQANWGSIYMSGLGFTPPSSDDFVYYSTKERLLFLMVCGESPEELRNRIAYRSGLGAFYFEPPRLFKERPLFCNHLRHVHHAFSVDEDGQTVNYRHLLDYVSRNIPDNMTVAHFDQTFWGKNQNTLQALENTQHVEVAEFTSQVHDSFKEKEDRAFNSKLQRAYQDRSYQSMDLPEDDLDSAFLSQELSRYYNYASYSKPYARGIHQFEMDVVDYNLRVLVSLLPKDHWEHRQFLKTVVYGYIDRLMELSFYVDSRFPNYPNHYRDYLCSKLLEEQVNRAGVMSVSIEAISMDPADSDSCQNLIAKSGPSTLPYQFIVHHQILDLEDEIIDYFATHEDLQDQRDSILPLVSQLLSHVQASFNHSIMVKLWLRSSSN